MCCNSLPVHVPHWCMYYVLFKLNPKYYVKQMYPTLYSKCALLLCPSGAHIFVPNFNIVNSPMYGVFQLKSTFRAVSQGCWHWPWSRHRYTTRQGQGQVQGQYQGRGTRSRSSQMSVKKQIKVIVKTKINVKVKFMVNVKVNVWVKVKLSHNSSELLLEFTET